MPGPQSWDWDDDSLLPRRDDYSEAEIHRMEVAAMRRRRGGVSAFTRLAPAPAPSLCDRPATEGLKP